MAYRRLKIALILVFAALLAACGGSNKKEEPVPTLFSDALNTQTALTAAAPTTAPLPTLTPSELPSVAPIPTETPSITDTIAPTETLAPSVTPGEVQAQATGIIQTNTAAAATGTAGAQVLPITQTMGAIAAATSNAQLTLQAASPTPPESSDPYQIIFYSNRNGSDDIYLLRLDGSDRLLIGGAANEREPSCSPDGSSLIFASDASGSYQIYSQPMSGTTPVQLTDSEGLNFAPIFSPDGSTIAFVSTRSDGVPTIWLMNADGSNQRELTTELGRDTSPSWGPDGRQLLFSTEQGSTWDIFLTVLDDVEGEFPMLPPEFSGGNEMWPIFDPAGERIAYTSWADLNDPQTADIYVVDFELEEPIPVRVGSGADIAWAWGDDTHLLASVGGPNDIQIALVDVTTGETFPLTHQGSFNGGARLCTVQPSILPPEPQPLPTATPTEIPPTESPTEVLPTATTAPGPTPTVNASALNSEEHPLSAELAASQGRQHVVSRGENLLGISEAYGVPWTEIAALNSIVNPDFLNVGQRIVIPVTRTGPRQGGYQLPDSDLTGEIAVVKTIVVDLSEQRAYALEDGRVVRNVLVSTGLPDSPTVQGEYHVYSKRISQTMSGPGYYLPGVPYIMYFYQGYGLHGTYWHNNFGHPMSHGCVNLPTIEAKWFYYWADVGTPVYIKP